jgi:hypothetical protein
MPPPSERYTVAFIMNYCLENNIILTKDISNEKTNSKYTLEGKCKTENCLNEWKKTMKTFYDNGGPYCATCAKENGKIKIKQTSLKRYGKEHHLQTKEGMEKQRKTMMERHGVGHALQNPDIMKRRDSTMIERWGVKHAAHNDELNQKMKDTNMERRGVEYPLLSKDVKELIRQTCLKNHGVEHPWQSEEIRENIKKTMMERHGVENPSQSEDVKELKRQTCLKNHGVEHPWQSEEIRENIKKTMMERHGVEHPMQSETFKQLANETLYANWGVSSPLLNDELQRKRQQTCTNNWGVPYPNQNPEILKRAQKTGFRAKLFTLSSGEVWSLQGYEHLVAPKLIEEYGEENIISDACRVPKIPWKCSRVDCSLCSNGLSHSYTCDFYIETLNLLIEIKSTWTAQQDADKIQRTQKASNELGYDFRLIVLNNKGEWVEDTTTSNPYPPCSTSSPS